MHLCNKSAAQGKLHGPVRRKASAVIPTPKRQRSRYLLKVTGDFVIFECDRVKRRMFNIDCVHAKCWHKMVLENIHAHIGVPSEEK